MSKVIGGSVDGDGVINGGCIDCGSDGGCDGGSIKIFLNLAMKTSLTDFVVQSNFLTVI